MDAQCRAESSGGCEVTIDTMLDVGRLDEGCTHYGCSHYRRRCLIRAPCCDEIFGCRHCHNEDKNSMDVDPLERHDIPRHEVQKVICSLCGTEQDVQQNCVNCGVCMGKYFCEKCKFFDDDTSKQQYHCDGCGICRVGGQDNFFHCYRCGCCYSILLKDCHPCVERAMHHNCPVCFEFLFESTKDISVLPCGHTIHMACFKKMQEHLREPGLNYLGRLAFHSVSLICKAIAILSLRYFYFFLSVADMPVQFVPSLSAICLKYGRSLIRRLLQLLCLKSTRIKWYGSCAMIVEELLKSVFILLPISAKIAIPITLGRLEEVLLQTYVYLLFEALNV